MVFIKQICSVLISFVFFAVPLNAAGPIGLGTSQQGTLTYTLGSAIARTLFKTTDIRATVQPNTGTGVMIPLVANGELDFGFCNAIELDQAIKGQSVFKGRPNPDLRVVARLFPAQVGLLVKADSTIRSIKDLKGAKITTGYQSTPILHDFIVAMLISEGLSLNDITQVPVPSLVRGAEAFISGRADVTFFAAGVAKVSEIDASVGGVRFISLSTIEEDVKRMQSVIPRAYISEITPRPGLAGITEPTNLLTYDYTLLAAKTLSDDLVYKVVEAIDKNKDTLINSSGIFRRMDRNLMSMDIGLDYHKGAMNYYKDNGLWPIK